MVTSKLTAAAVQAQISSQKQRLAALEANLGTIESGMDKHMVQVQLKYAHGYLEALQEQLAALQGTSPAANDQYLAQGLAANLQGTKPTANDQYLADTYTSGSGHNPGRTDASAATTDSAAAEEHVVHTGYAALTDSNNVTAGGYGVEAHPVALQDSNDSDDGEFTHEVYHEVESHDGTLVWEYEHAAEAESAAAAAAAAAAAEAAAEQAAAAIAAAAIADHPQQAVVAGQGHKAAQPASKASQEDTTSAGDCSLIDEDGWLCLTDATTAAAAHDSTGGAGNHVTARRTGWAGVWSWGN